MREKLDIEDGPCNPLESRNRQSGCVIIKFGNREWEKTWLFYHICLSDVQHYPNKAVKWEIFQQIWAKVNYDTA